MIALWNRVDHYIFILWFLSIFYLYFFLSRLISADAHYFHTWCDLSANLECRSEMCGMQLAENAGLKKKSPKIAIWAPSHNFVGLYLRNQGTYRQLEKNC